MRTQHSIVGATYLRLIDPTAEYRVAIMIAIGE